MYNVRYRVLLAATTIRNVAACVAFLAGSYLASGLINATPVTQRDLRAPRSRAIIVAPAVLPKPDEMPISPPEVPFASPAEATQIL